jgi:hypothetical protein
MNNCRVLLKVSRPLAQLARRRMMATQASSGVGFALTEEQAGIQGTS